MTLSKEYTEEDINDLNQKSLQLQNILLDNSELNEESTEEIITILVTTTNEERQLIRAEYKKQNNHPIQDDINAKLKENYSNFNDMFINMFDTPYEYDAKELYKVLSSKDSNEDTIIEIFSTRPKSYLDIIDIAYKKFFNISLRDEIKKQFHKIFADFLLAIMDNERPLEQTISGDDAYEIANEIIKNGYKEYCSDVNLFKKLFIEKSREDLILISRAYYELTKNNIYDIFEEENIDDEKDEEKKGRNKNIQLIKGLLFGVITPSEFFAKKCIEALTGSSIDLNTLSRVLINRVEIDMNAIRDYYFKDTQNDLSKEIENAFKENGEIGTLLLNLSVQ
jgi:hypothetical protein